MKKIIPLVAVMAPALALATPAADLEKAFESADRKKVMAVLKKTPALATAKLSDGRTPLLRAADSGDADAVTFLLAHKADPKDKDSLGAGLMSHAGSPAVADALLKAGVATDDKDSAGSTPLHYAASNSNTDVLKWLLAHKADAKATNAGGATPLHQVQDLDGAAALVAAGADVNARDSGGETPLFHAVNLAKTDIIGFLVDKKADINAKSKSGTTPLSLATKNGDADTAKLLKAKGAK